ncbi:hypothetical protein CK203_035785 [Vitis vinifera]|uniref:Sacsin n=1 Tax=Vitis vinifera TaxID=29760 RepID=A0A438FZ15_VITVI|nr:hypothetical protein CK203_035785 [Vitis vinifera]
MMSIKFNGFGSSKRGLVLWQAASIALIRVVWWERNARIFEDKARNSEYLWDFIVFLACLWAFCSKVFKGTPLNVLQLDWLAIEFKHDVYWRECMHKDLFRFCIASCKDAWIAKSFWFGVKFEDLLLGGGRELMVSEGRYLAYNLTPVAGVAAHISRNGHPADSYLSNSNSIMCPLPLSSDINMPVTVLGCFLVRHNGGRYLFKCQDREAAVEARPDAGNLLIEAWNRELMSCVRDSYIEMAYGDRIYSFWPRSTGNSLVNEPSDGSNLISTNVLKADWECLIEHVIRPFYARLVDLPVWQLYSLEIWSRLKRVCFFPNLRNGVGGNLLPATVCGFVKEHYPVFSVPWELVTEIQAVGVTVREVKPKMVRDLLRVASTSIVLRSVDTYVDVLEYCLSDIHISESSNPSTVDTSLDTFNSNSIYRASKEEGSSSTSVSIPHVQRLNGMSTQNAANSGGDALEMVTTLGRLCLILAGELLKILVGGEGLWFIGTALQRLTVSNCNNASDKVGVTELWIGNKEQQTLMIPLAAKFIHSDVLDRSILADIFCNPVLQTLLKLQNFSVRLLSNHMRKLFHESWWLIGRPLTLSDWPLIPAFLGRPILCRVRERQLVFIPPPTIDHVVEMSATEIDPTGISINHSSETESLQSYISAFKAAENKYPWLLSLLNQCNIPIFDAAFMECAARSSERDELFALFASDFSSNGSKYGREELEVLRALPIYKTVTGSYTQLQSQDLCMIPSSSFLKPCDERCLSYPTDSVESSLLRALAVPELQDQQILVDSSVVEALKEARFRKKFPGERFTTDGWLRILRKTGLRTAAEADVILECARRVEFLASECMKPRGDLDDFESDLSTSQNEISLEIWSLAGSVVESVFSNFAVLYSNNFCNLLGKIAFVPTERGFPSVGGKKGGKRVLSSYSEVVLLKDWPLAWSCAPILSKQNVVPPEYSWGAFHLRSPPVFSTVINICRNGGEDTLAHWPTASGMMTIDEASCEVLKYLDKVWGSLSSSGHHSFRPNLSGHISIRSSLSLSLIPASVPVLRAKGENTFQSVE